MLKVCGNKLCCSDEQGNCREIRLQGVNRAGLEWDANDPLILDSIKYVCDEWGANCIRLPVSQDRWFGFMPEQDKESGAEAYRAKVDAIIAEVAQRDGYLILDLHWSNLGVWGEHVGQHKMPDVKSLVFWLDAAARYKNHPNVLFGIYNEPHIEGDYKISPWEIWKNGGTLVEGDITYRAVGMQELICSIRNTGAKNLIVVAGLDWGYSLTGVASGYDLYDPDGNGLLFDSHVYPWKPLDWDADVTIASALHPILIGEFGHYGNDAKPNEGVQSLPCEEWMPRLLAWIKQHGYSYTAWDFHPKAGPCLIKSFNNEPTEFHGRYVYDFLRENRK